MNLRTDRFLRQWSSAKSLLWELQRVFSAAPNIHCFHHFLRLHWFPRRSSDDGLGNACAIVEAVSMLPCKSSTYASYDAPDESPDECWNGISYCIWTKNKNRNAKVHIAKNILSNTTFEQTFVHKFHKRMVFRPYECAYVSVNVMWIAVLSRTQCIFSFLHCYVSFGALK